jgi:hypothetical protein
LAVISGVAETEAVVSSYFEKGVEAGKELVENHAGEDRGKGVALRKAFILEKEVEGAFRGVEIAAVGRTVHKVKIR